MRAVYAKLWANAFSGGRGRALHISLIEFAMPVRTEHWKFRPHPLLRGGHLQTVAAVYCRVSMPRTVRAPLHRSRRRCRRSREAINSRCTTIARRVGGQMARSVLLVRGLAGCHTSATCAG